jgi:hypothetical protein
LAVIDVVGVHLVREKTLKAGGGGSGVKARTRITSD